MAGTGNLMAVMDAMGQSRMEVTRIYQHPGLRQVTEAIEKRNQQGCTECDSAQKLAHRVISTFVER